MNFIKNWHNEHKKSKLVQRQLGTMLDAIQAQDAKTIKKAWDGTEDKKKFMDSVTDDGRGFFGSMFSEDGYSRNTHVYSRLIVSAINTGNIDVFKAVFEQNPDPNYVVSHWARGEFADMSESNEPILALAIKMGKEAIALHLSEQPDIRKDVVGHKWSKGFMRSDNSFEMDPVPLELARTTPGMKNVFHEMVKKNFPRSSANTKAAQDFKPR